MIFNSLEFLIFLPIVVLLHYLLPLKYRWIMLLAASYFFYMYWDATLIYLIVFTTLVSYASAILMHKSKSRAIRNLYLLATLLTSLGVLVFFKYYNFLANSVTDTIALFGGGEFDITLDLILPVGISFYTFQTLSYVIDVYRGDIEPEPHLGYYALFVSFFPQLVAGPIERPDNLLPQLKAEHKFDRNNFVEGFGIMIVGFFKKLVVADIAAVYVNAVYNDAVNSNGLSVLIATVLFAVQIYCDFSGYTDIAIGCARMMGITLMQNFNRPYSAKTIKEFWARWHISLSTWFRDYLYIPLGGNRRGKIRRYLNVFIVFLVSGLWHGAAWTFVIWGALHGLYQIIGGVTQKPREKLCGKLGIDVNSRGFGFYKQAVTFVLVCFAWIFFRANNFTDLGMIVGKLFTDWGASLDYIKESFNIMGLDVTMTLAIIVSIFTLSLFDKKNIRAIYRADADTDAGDACGESAVSASVNYAGIIWIVIIAALIIASGDGESSFIYFQF